ncbi:MAG: D-glycero-beta-D-manno-heptose 1-phosphate adenylyltransferase [Desulfovibrionales bacterium]
MTTTLESGKIVTWKEIGTVRQVRARQRLVFTNGCFDLLHPGHVDLLQRCRELGDLLVVGVNSDVSVRRLKGPRRPVVAERARCYVLAALGCVDFVVIFSQDTPLELITVVQPDILVKGGDWSVDTIVGRDVVYQRGGEVLSLPLLPGYSTTGLIATIVRRHGAGETEQ